MNAALTNLSEQDIQVINLRKMKNDDFIYLFEDIIGRVKPYLPKNSALVFYIGEIIHKQIDQTLEAWQASEGIDEMDQMYFSGLLQNLSEKRDLYIITS